MAVGAYAAFLLLLRNRRATEINAMTASATPTPRPAFAPVDKPEELLMLGVRVEEEVVEAKEEEAVEEEAIEEDLGEYEFAFPDADHVCASPKGVLIYSQVTVLLNVAVAKSVDD